MFEEINRDIRAHYSKTANEISTSFGIKSEQWSRDHKKNLGQMMVDGPILDGIHNAQETRVIYTSHVAGSVDAGLCAEQLLDDLHELGFDLDAAPEEYKEADITSPGQLIPINGRSVSVDFLYRLNICQRIGDILHEPGITVLEIGGGLGALARTIKLINPSVKYVIIDLLDTLVVSYGFLRACFPESSTTFVTDNTQLGELKIESDFTFIPAQIVPLRNTENEASHNDIPRWDIDLAVNTQSLGEMRQDTTEGYMDLLENRMNVKRFYSLNHFLHQEALVGQWRSEAVGSTNPTALGPYWDVLHWEFSPPFVGHTRYGDQDHTLELYVQKVDSSSVTDDELRERSDKLLAEADSLGKFRGHSWQRLMWDSIRFCPRTKNIEPYYRFLKDSNRRQCRYFRGLLLDLGVQVEEVYTVPARVPLLKRGPRKLAGAIFRRLANKLEPPYDPTSMDVVTTL